MNVYSFHDVNRLMTYNEFHLIMLNGGLSVEKYGLSEKFSRSKKNKLLFVSVGWTLHQHQTELILTNRLDAEEIYILCTPIWIVFGNDLNGESVETWSARLRNFMVTGLEEADKCVERLQSLYHQVPIWRKHAKYHADLLEQVPMESLIDLVDRYFTFATCIQYTFVSDLNKEALIRIIMTSQDGRHPMWWSDQVQEHITRLEKEMKEMENKWIELLQCAREVSAGNKRWKAAAEEEE